MHNKSIFTKRGLMESSEPRKSLIESSETRRITNADATGRKSISNAEYSASQHKSKIENPAKYGSNNESFKNNRAFDVDDDNKSVEAKVNNYPINQFLELDEEKREILALVLNNQIGGGDINNMSYNLNLLNTYVSLVNPLYIVNQLLMLEMENITLNPINLNGDFNILSSESDNIKGISDAMVGLSTSLAPKDSDSKRKKKRAQKNYECIIIRDEISRLLERYHHILLDDYKWCIETSREKDKQIIKFTNTTKKDNMNTIINYLRRIIKLLKQEFPTIDIDIRKDYDSIDNCARNSVCLILEH